MKSSSSTSFKKLSPYSPRVVSLNYIAFPIDNAVLVYGNTPQTYTANCDLPGFPSVTVTILANTYQSFVSQADANAKALAAATAEAIAQLVCCYSDDPLPDTPNFGSLSNLYTNSGTTYYGLLPIEDIAEEIEPYVSELHNWTTCPTCDFCDGPEEEGITQPEPYSQRWFVRESGGSYAYGKESITQLPVPSDLFTGIDQEDITYMSISFDANARPCFAFQITGGTILLRRYVGGTPTFITFAGDTPKLYFDGVLQPDNALTDLTCFYVRVGAIQVRIQRENFLTEHTQLSPSPQAVRITKTDAYASHQNLYFTDAAGRYWLARSEIYPPFPVISSDTGSVFLLPASGVYTLTTIATGPYSDASSLALSPSTGNYVLTVVPAGSYSDDSSLAVLPGTGSYLLTIVDGGTYTDTSLVSVLPSTGVYTQVIVPGGSYTENGTLLVKPGTGSYT